MTYSLRPYQAQAVNAAVRYLKDPKRQNNGLMVLPTGSGKSLIAANIVRALDAPCLVFQPSKEILEQNYEKYISYGYTAGIYSASVGRKEIFHTTFATIGSVRKDPGAFERFPYVIIDECEAINAKQGMYHDFLETLGELRNIRVLGMTATPYRLVSYRGRGSILKFLTRTRPRVFTDVIYYINNGTLFDAGYLCRIEYAPKVAFDRGQLRLNSTGADYDDRSVQNYYGQIGFAGRVLATTDAALRKRRNALVFTRFIQEAEYVASHLPGTAIVTADTPKQERERIVEGFRSGRIRAVANVGVLVCGFDFPELECVIIARPTMSLRLWYQMIGRGIRVSPQKDHTLVVDMCGNKDLFGPIEDLELVDGGNGKWYVRNKERQLTNVFFGQEGVEGREYVHAF